MERTANFLVNPRLTRLLGETYRSSEAALKELIDNAWDADASSVTINLPKPMTQDPIVVQDDGCGMSEGQLRQEYLEIARDKRRTQGARTTRYNRKTKGRKGIGKFAGLSIASEMRLDSTKDGMTCRLVLDKVKLTNTEDDLETIPLDLEVLPQPQGSDGTTVVLSDLDQTLNFPRPETLKQLLYREYGREQDFAIFVDGEEIGFKDLSGTHFRNNAKDESSGNSLSFTITDEKSKPRSPGIALRVDGKIVGKPSFYGLEDDPEIPAKLLRSVVGEIEVPDTPGLVTADWGGVNESSKAYTEIAEQIRTAVKEKLSVTHKRQISAQKARLQKQINARLAKLPENKREFAEKALHRILGRFYGESDERIGVIVDVALDAIELDGYWAVLNKINDASRGAVIDFADALADFGLLELSNLGVQARNRDFFLTHLQHLTEDTSTLEVTMHRALEENLWVFGLKRALISSNATLKRMLETYLSKEYKGSRAEERPDLFLGEAMDGSYLLIEFKRPSKVIGRKEISQAEGYRDDLQKQLASDAIIEVIVVGKNRDPSIRPDNLAAGVIVESYSSSISRSRTEISWLLRQLKEHA